MTALFRRILTAGVLLGLFVAAVFWAPAWLWSILIASVLGLAAYEWGRLSLFPPAAALAYALGLTVCALGLPALLDADWPLYQAGIIVLAAVFWLAVAPLWLLLRWRVESLLLRAVTGVVLLLPTWAALLYIHGLARGPAILLGVMAIAWIADTAAFFSGRRFGRRKLAPAISPGKTWEGVAGAWVALMVYAFAITQLVSMPMVALLVMFSGFLYLSILGDLFESWIKRVAGMKDSGNVLPGHGGVLDRIDALTSTLPIAAGILMWLEIAR